MRSTLNLQPKACNRVVLAGGRDVECIRRLYRALCANEAALGFKADPDWLAQPAGAQYLAQRLGGTGLALVVRERATGPCIAYLLAGPRAPSHQPAVALESMFVAAEYRRAQIATRLVHACFRWMEQVGESACSVAVAAANRPAVALYRRCGFVERAAVDHCRTLILVAERRAPRRAEGRGPERTR